MKLFLTVVGTLCLVGIIQAQSTPTIAQSQSTVSLNVAGNLSLALTAINQTINLINTTINTTDTVTLAAVTRWRNYTIGNLTALVNRFQNYTGNLGNAATSLNNSISSLTSASNAAQALLLGTDTYTLPNLFNTVWQLANTTGNTVLQAAYNLSSYATCANNVSLVCLRKYGANLTAAPILLTRFNDCLTPEITKIANVGANITVQVNNDMIVSQSFYSLMQLCNIPTAAAMNSTNPQTTPSVNCINTFLSQISNQQSIGSLNYGLSSLMWSPIQSISFRVNRCIQMVQGDIQDTVTRVNAAFSSCLVTGK
ncbi:uncharacterized protein LOC129725294 [Wyeomyia smithii]|uniref:uncharacterized protein LOC129725294 n=1 Tax=Wyeomyia smithii TaxID=174621 RepID=UPI002467D342|nr:uncharacterized protein LOC129725294 [Wyeomyia smithii]